jgi:hypothetical protein
LAAKQREKDMAFLNQRGTEPHARQADRDAYWALNPKAVDKFRAEALAKEARQAQEDREVHAITF